MLHHHSSPRELPTLDFLNAECKNLPLFTSLKNGFKAMSKVKGIKRLYMKGIAVCFITTAILVALFFTFDAYFVAPWLLAKKVNYVTDSIWTGYLVTPVYWITKICLYILYIYAAFKIAFLVMIYWTDLMIEKVINHFRPLDLDFSAKRFTKVFLIGMRTTAISLTFGLLFFALSFIPVIGSVIAIFGIAIISGRDIYDPYVMILADQDQDLARKYRFNTKHVLLGGCVQALIYVVPFIGWVFLPFTYLLQVIGYTYFCEEKWSAQVLQERSH